MRKASGIFFIAILLIALLPTTHAQSDPSIELRVLIFEEGNTIDVMEALITEFEQENPDIVVELDVIPFYSELTEILTEQIEDGNAPDLVRVTELGRFSDSYLDLRPYLSNAEEWDDNFAPELLAAMRVDPNSDSLHGYPTDFTISGPYINRALFEEAGIEVPSDSSDSVSWQEWETAVRAVQDALNTDEREIHGMIMDRSGHRFWGPSLSLCATYLQDDNTMTMDTPGFRAAAEMLYNWHTTGLTALDVWAAPGEQYIDPGDIFEAGNAVFHFSGSWKVSEYQNISDFEWEVVPGPVGECGSSGMVGGGVMVAMSDTEYPEAVGRLMSYLTAVENMERFHSETLFLPGHRELIENGVQYLSNADALNVFTTELGKVSPEAYGLQYHPLSSQIHTQIRLRLLQVMIEELTVEEAAELLQADIDALLEAE